MDLLGSHRWLLLLLLPATLPHYFAVAAENRHQVQCIQLHLLLSKYSARPLACSAVPNEPSVSSCKIHVLTD
jgi:hypothetical protein